MSPFMSCTRCQRSRSHRHWLPHYTKTGLQTIGLREGWCRERGLANTRGARKRSRPTTARASAADPNPTIVRWRVRLVAQTFLTQCEASNCRRRAFTVKPPRRRTIRTPQPHSASKLSHGPVRRPTGRRGSVHDRTDLPPGCGDTHQTITDWNSSAPQDSRHQASGHE